jgi:hypothetical protein
VNRLYEAVADRAEHRCEYCRAPESVFNFPFEVEHIVPISRGGTSELDNLALACHACNRFKGDATAGFDSATDTEEDLYHPRRAHWPEHFVVNSDSGVISERTPAGRATVHRLRMNREQQTSARLWWIRLSLFP